MAQSGQGAVTGLPLCLEPDPKAHGSMELAVIALVFPEVSVLPLGWNP